MLKIGVTEAGDAGVDQSWVSRMSSVDAAVLITKHVSNEFIENALFYRDKIIVHATCTGYGGTVLEPYVPEYRYQLNSVRRLISLGFPANQIVIRVDPIIPTAKGLRVASTVVDYAVEYIRGVSRFRFSVLDMYPHVTERFCNAGIPIPKDDFVAVDKWIGGYASNIIFETCAEPRLHNCKHVGCISTNDLEILGIEIPDSLTVGYQRNNCMCLSNKVELLGCKGRCRHQCLYCFWKDEKEV